MKNVDTRIQVTKTLLHQAILDILREKPIDRVTVKELVDRAGLNRGTFYLHYNTPHDVLKEIENDFIAQNMEYFDTYWLDGKYVSAMERVFTCILQNKELCSILMGDNGDPQFLISMGMLCRDSVIGEWKREYPACGRQELEFLFDFVFPGSTRLILSWIEDDRGLSGAEFARRLERLGHYCLVAATEF